MIRFRSDARLTLLLMRHHQTVRRSAKAAKQSTGAQPPRQAVAEVEHIDTRRGAAEQEATPLARAS